MDSQIKWHPPWNSVCMWVYVKPTSVWAVVEKENRLMKTIGRPEWVWPPVCKCHNMPVPVWCFASVQYASMGIRGPLLNCVADSRRLSHTNTHTPQQAQRPFLKSLPPLDEPSGMHVICPRRRLNPGPSALVSFGGGTLPGRLYDTVSLHTGLDSGQGRGQALRLAQQSGAVYGCPSWQIDHPPSLLLPICCISLHFWILFMLFRCLWHVREPLNSPLPDMLLK